MIEYKAIQKNISLDYESGKKLITFMIEEGCTDQSIEFCREKPLMISIRPYRKKRSLDANAYYWKLIGVLAAKLRMSTSELHNRMLMEWGQLEMINNQFITVELPDTIEAEKRAYTAETYHLKPTSEVCRYGADMKRKWLILRGSHEYNTEEFSHLLNGLIEECKWQGIPTETPDQIARMMAAYKEKYG